MPNQSAMAASQMTAARTECQRGWDGGIRTLAFGSYITHLGAEDADRRSDVVRAATMSAAASASESTMR